MSSLNDISKAASSAGSSVASAAGGVANAVGSDAAKAASAVASEASKAGSAISAESSKAAGAISSEAANVGNQISSAASDIGSQVAATAADIGKQASEMVDSAKETASAKIDDFKNNAASTAKDMLLGAAGITGISDLLDKFVSKTGATLVVDGLKKREIISFDYSFTQPVDKVNQPAGIPRGGKINMTVKALNDGNAEILTWMLNEFSKKNGKIEVMVPGEEKKMKDIEFTDAYCTEYQEKWEDKVSAKDNLLGGVAVAYAHTEIFTLTCRKIQNGVTYESEWK